MNFRQKFLAFILTYAFVLVPWTIIAVFWIRVTHGAGLGTGGMNSIFALFMILLTSMMGCYLVLKKSRREDGKAESDSEELNWRQKFSSFSLLYITSFMPCMMFLCLLYGNPPVVLPIAFWSCFAFVPLAYLYYRIRGKINREISDERDRAVVADARLRSLLFGFVVAAVGMHIIVTYSVWKTMIFFTGNGLLGYLGLWTLLVVLANSFFTMRQYRKYGSESLSFRAMLRRNFIYSTLAKMNHDQKFSAISLLCIFSVVPFCAMVWIAVASNYDLSWLGKGGHQFLEDWFDYIMFRFPLHVALLVVLGYVCLKVFWRTADELDRKRIGKADLYGVISGLSLMLVGVISMTIFTVYLGNNHRVGNAHLIGSFQYLCLSLAFGVRAITIFRLFRKPKATAEKDSKKSDAENMSVAYAGETIQ